LKNVEGALYWRCPGCCMKMILLYYWNVEGAHAAWFVLDFKMITKDDFALKPINKV
jgi:hypothetical protein